MWVPLLVLACNIIFFDYPRKRANGKAGDFVATVRLRKERNLSQPHILKDKPTQLNQSQGQVASPFLHFNHAPILQALPKTNPHVANHSSLALFSCPTSPPTLRRPLAAPAWRPSAAARSPAPQPRQRRPARPTDHSARPSQPGSSKQPAGWRSGEAYDVGL